MTTILAILAGLVINGTIAFGIAWVSRNMWMVLALVVVFKGLEMAVGHYFGIQNMNTAVAWVVTFIVGFLFFMITAQLHFYLRDRRAQKV